MLARQFSEVCFTLSIGDIVREKMLSVWTIDAEYEQEMMQLPAMGCTVTHPDPDPCVDQVEPDPVRPSRSPQTPGAAAGPGAPAASPSPSPEFLGLTPLALVQLTSQSSETPSSHVHVTVTSTHRHLASTCSATATSLRPGSCLLGQPAWRKLGINYDPDSHQISMVDSSQRPRNKFKRKFQIKVQQI